VIGFKPCYQKKLLIKLGKFDNPKENFNHDIHNITMEKTPKKTPDNLLKRGLPRIIAALVALGVDVEMGKVTVAVAHGTAWPV